MCIENSTLNSWDRKKVLQLIRVFFFLLHWHLSLFSQWEYLALQFCLCTAVGKWQDRLLWSARPKSPEEKAKWNGFERQSGQNCTWVKPAWFSEVTMSLSRAQLSCQESWKLAWVSLWCAACGTAISAL